MQARRIPVGAAGVGYVLRRGYELPPLMFTEDEAEAIAVGVRMFERIGGCRERAVKGHPGCARPTA